MDFSDFYFADHLLISGGLRKPTKQNPKNKTIQNNTINSRGKASVREESEGRAISANESRIRLVLKQKTADYSPVCAAVLGLNVV